jgi:hypothetical protein
LLSCWANMYLNKKNLGLSLGCPLGRRTHRLAPEPTLFLGVFVFSFLLLFLLASERLKNWMSSKTRN